jgi:hypothetical protein
MTKRLSLIIGYSSLKKLVLLIFGPFVRRLRLRFQSGILWKSRGEDARPLSSGASA